MELCVYVCPPNQSLDSKHVRQELSKALLADMGAADMRSIKDSHIFFGCDSCTTSDTGVFAKGYHLRSGWMFCGHSDRPPLRRIRWLFVK